MSVFVVYVVFLIYSRYSLIIDRAFSIVLRSEDHFIGVAGKDCFSNHSRAPWPHGGAILK